MTPATQRAIELLKQLIATPSHTHDEGATADLLASFLEREGVAVERIHNNLIARSEGFDPARDTLLLNCNADSVTQAVALGASRIAPTDLVFCFEKKGVLRDAEDEGSVIERITPASYATLKADGIVSGGMIPKIENALRAVAEGVRTVRIKHADDLLCEAGTTICNE